MLDTLAAAHAATADYAQAVTVAHEAQQLARRQGATAFADAIEQRLALYALEKPFVDVRSPPPDLEAGEDE